MKQPAIKKIENALWAGNRLSGLDILYSYNVYRASGLIEKLRKRGVPIQTQMVERNGKRYGVYYIHTLDCLNREFNIV